jgi:hypothetical protein
MRLPSATRLCLVKYRPFQNWKLLRKIQTIFGNRVLKCKAARISVKNYANPAQSV